MVKLKPLKKGPNEPKVNAKSVLTQSDGGMARFGPETLEKEGKNDKQVGVEEKRGR